MARMRGVLSSPLEITVDILARGGKVMPDGTIEQNLDLHGQNVSFFGRVISVEKGGIKGNYSAIIEDISQGDAFEACCLYSDKEFVEFVQRLGNQPPARITIVGNEDNTPIMMGDGSFMKTSYERFFGSLEDGLHPSRYVEVRGMVLGKSPPYIVRAYFVNVHSKGWL